MQSTLAVRSKNPEVSVGHAPPITVELLRSEPGSELPFETARAAMRRLFMDAIVPLRRASTTTDSISEVPGGGGFLRVRACPQGVAVSAGGACCFPPRLTRTSRDLPHGSSLCSNGRRDDPKAAFGRRAFGERVANPTPQLSKQIKP